jgi:hypothetical protein
MSDPNWDTFYQGYNRFYEAAEHDDVRGMMDAIVIMQSAANQIDRISPVTNGNLAHFCYVVSVKRFHAQDAMAQPDYQKYNQMAINHVNLALQGHEKDFRARAVAMCLSFDNVTILGTDITQMITGIRFNQAGYLTLIKRVVMASIQQFNQPDNQSDARQLADFAMQVGMGKSLTEQSVSELAGRAIGAGFTYAYMLETRNQMIISWNNLYDSFEYWLNEYVVPDGEFDHMMSVMMDVARQASSFDVLRVAAKNLYYLIADTSYEGRVEWMNTQPQDIPAEKQRFVQRQQIAKAYGDQI